MILEGAPASIVAIGQQRYPYFPVRLLIRNPSESIQRIHKIGSPVLFLHSPEDQTVPLSEGRRLFNAALQPKAVRRGARWPQKRQSDRSAFLHRFLQGLQLLP